MQTNSETAIKYLVIVTNKKCFVIFDDFLKANVNAKN